MEMNSLNLAARFILEMAALIAMGMWGWKFSDGSIKYLLIPGIPIFAAVVWGVFNVPGDPSRSGGAPIEVSGILRLLIELGIFAVAIWMLYQVGYDKLSIFFAIAVMVHYIVSYERVLWLLRP